MGERDRTRPLEQPQTRAFVTSLLDYLVAQHGAIIEVIVRDWLKKKDERLAWKNEEKDT